MKLKWKEVKEGIWEAKTDVGVFTIESGESGCRVGLGYFDATKEGEYIAYAFDIGQAKRYARTKYKELKKGEEIPCPCCDGTGYCEGEHYDDLQPCLTCGGSGYVC